MELFEFALELLARCAAVFVVFGAGGVFGAWLEDRQHKGGRK